MQNNNQLEKTLIRDINIKNISNLVEQNKLEQILFNIPNLKKLEINDFVNEVLMITLLNNFDSLNNINKIVNFVAENNDTTQLFIFEFLNNKYSHLIKIAGEYPQSLFNVSEKILQQNLIIEESDIDLFRKKVEESRHLNMTMNNRKNEIIKRNLENINKSKEKIYPENTKQMRI